jgi:hypothetical protein
VPLGEVVHRRDQPGHRLSEGQCAGQDAIDQLDTQSP